MFIKSISIIKTIQKLAYMALCAALLLAPLLALANVDPRQEIRYCTDTPARASDGTIARDMSILGVFKKQHPCPLTGKPDGACPGWAVNHVVPLAVGGCDAVWNMQWLPNGIKSCKGDICIDRWERKYWVRPVHGIIK